MARKREVKSFAENELVRDMGPLIWEYADDLQLDIERYSKTYSAARELYRKYHLGWYRDPQFHEHWDSIFYRFIHGMEDIYSGVSLVYQPFKGLSKVEQFSYIRSTLNLMRDSGISQAGHDEDFFEVIEAFLKDQLHQQIEKFDANAKELFNDELRQVNPIIRGYLG